MHRQVGYKEPAFQRRRRRRKAPETDTAAPSNQPNKACATIWDVKCARPLKARRTTSLFPCLLILPRTDQNQYVLRCEGVCTCTYCEPLTNASIHMSVDIDGGQITDRNISIHNYIVRIASLFRVKSMREFRAYVIGRIMWGDGGFFVDSYLFGKLLNLFASCICILSGRSMRKVIVRFCRWRGWERCPMSCQR